MSNFTRSIFYSTGVIVIALVAVIAIYSDFQSTQNGLAVIEPAAGEETYGMEEAALNYQDTYAGETAEASEDEGVLSEILNTIAPAAGEYKETLESKVEAAQDATAEAINTSEEVVTKQVEAAEAAVEEATEAVTEAIEETVPPLTESIPTEAEAAIEDVQEAAEETVEETAEVVESTLEDVEAEAEAEAPATPTDAQ